MQSNNSNENNKIINKNNIEELLLQNQELFNRLILANINKREKSYISAGEYEILQSYENNLIQLIERCPTGKLSEIMEEIKHRCDKREINSENKK